MSTLYLNNISPLVGDGTITMKGNVAVTGSLTVTGTLHARMTDFVVNANSTTLGDASGDTITINGSTVSVPNNLTFDTSTLHIDASNNRVGVGTTSPGAPLHVSASATTSTQTVEILRLEVNDKGADMNIGHGPGIDFFVGETGGSDYGGTVAVVREQAADANTDCAMVFHTTTDDQVKDNSREKMRITSAGKVGIGVTDPDSQLEVFSTSTQLKLSYNADDYATLAVDNDGQLDITTVDGGGTGGHICLLPDGNAGVGVSDPDTKLEVFAAATNQLKLSYNAGGYATFGVDTNGDLTITPAGGDATITATTSIDLKSPQIDIGEDDSSDVTINLLGSTNDMAIVYDESAKKLAFDSTDLVIDAASAFVGIGTASPAAPAHVFLAATTSTAPAEVLRLEVNDGGVDMNIGHGPGIDFFIGETGGSDYGGTVAIIKEVAGDADTACAMVFHTTTDDQVKDSSREKMRITSGGNVGIGTTSPSLGSTIGIDIENATASSATEGAALRLSSNDGATMAVGHRLGVIEFAGAEDSSSTITVGARIEALCDAAWTASENGTDLLFYTTDGNAAQSEHMRIRAAGNVGIGVSDADTKLEVLSTSTQLKLSYDADSFSTLAVASTSALTIASAESGDIILDPGGNNVLPGSDSADSLGASGTAWATVYADNIDLDGQGRIDLDDDQDTSIRASADDKITFELGGADELHINSTAIFPASNGGLDLGTTNLRFGNIFTQDLHLANDRGDWTVIEEEDYLSIRNNKNGKMYKFVLQEISEE